MQSITYMSNSEAATAKLGESLVGLLPESALVTLSGTLGAGKTLLVKAIAKAYGVRSESVVSPTFTLCNEYLGNIPIFHFDMYRIADEDELFELGFDEYLQRKGLTIVEWADRFPKAMPQDKLSISIEVVSEDSRRIELTAETAPYEAVLKALQPRLA